MILILQKFGFYRINYTRTVFTSPIYFGESKMMKKVLAGSTKKKHKYTDSTLLPTPKTFTKGAYEGMKSKSSKRVSVLNKLFMKHITDLMITGELSAMFVGKGIEINRVQVTPNFNEVRVYWLGKGTECDEVIDNLLNSQASALRQELSGLRVIGMVPKIKFYKDKKFAQLMEVDLRLAKADFGEDYTPSEIASKLKSELKLHTSLETHIKEQIQKLDSLEDFEEEPLPPMIQNNLGLNHAEIMERVQKSVKKSYATHRLENSVEDPQYQLEATTNSHPITFTSNKLQREMFKEFLAKRQLLVSKANKEMKNYRPELDYLEEEWEIKRQQYDSKINFNFYKEEDDIEDIEDDDLKR